MSHNEADNTEACGSIYGQIYYWSVTMACQETIN